MARRTRSKSFFINNDLKENPSFEKFDEEIKKKYKQMDQKRKFTGTTPLKHFGKPFQIERVELKKVCRPRIVL